MAKAARSRVDKLVVERGLADSREKARRLILAGDVLVDEAPVDKPGSMVKRSRRQSAETPSRRS